jgi:geranylgeranyl pyrophosphate synthase
MTTVMLNTPLTFLDPLSVRMEQVEALLTAQVDGNRSPLEATLAQLIAAGGKRIRPRLALLTGGLLAADPDPLLHLAAAVEMLHTATLIHDDLVDGAGLRRGVETLNARGLVAASVLVGDFAFTRAAQLALATRSLPVVGLFMDCMARMVDGELTQLARPRGISSLDEYYRWIGAKTAALFELAVGAPALFGSAGAEFLEPARCFGYSLGMAFQIMDDVLDFTGDTSSLGKPIGQDLRGGVLTLPALLYLESHPADPGLRALIERQPLPEAELERLVASIRWGGFIERAVDEARGYVRDGLDALQQLPYGPECSILEEIARSVVERNL